MQNAEIGDILDLNTQAVGSAVYKALMYPLFRRLCLSVEEGQRSRVRDSLTVAVKHG